MSPFAFVAAWVVHATLLGLVALLLPRLFRLRHPASLAGWWAGSSMGVVLLPLMPLVLPRQPPVPVPVSTFVEATTAILGPTADAAPAVSPIAWLLVAWGLGVAARAAWLGGGHRRLRFMAARGTSVDDDPALVRARTLAPAAALPPLQAARVPVVEVDEAGPCAFGALRPCILVPVALRQRPEDERVAVYLHELAHVARADVARALVDEVWRVLWWWQPPVWWLLARLRLAREQEVDALVVARIGRLRPYVEALLWCSTLRPALAPSSPVGGRTHALVERVALMRQGGDMSRRRRLLIGATMLMVMGGVTGVAGLWSPLRAAGAGSWAARQAEEPGPLERAAVRPTLDAPAPRRTLSVEPIWSGPEWGRVRVHVVLDAAGRIAEARVPMASALPSVAGVEPAAAADAVLTAVRQWQFEPPLRSPMLLVLDVWLGPDDGRRGSATALLAPRSSTPSAPLRVGGPIAPPKKLLDVPPVYPEDAKGARVAGVVIVEATIDTEGAVQEARVLRSIPLLDDAALAAVRQWRYEPTWLNGAPVPVIVTVTINFTLAP